MPDDPSMDPALSEARYTLTHGLSDCCWTCCYGSPMLRFIGMKPSDPGALFCQAHHGIAPYSLPVLGWGICDRWTRRPPDFPAVTALITALNNGLNLLCDDVRELFGAAEAEVGTGLRVTYVANSQWMAIWPLHRLSVLGDGTELVTSTPHRRRSAPC